MRGLIRNNFYMVEGSLKLSIIMSLLFSVLLVVTSFLSHEINFNYRWATWFIWRFNRYCISKRCYFKMEQI